MQARQNQQVFINSLDQIKVDIYFACLIIRTYQSDVV